MSDTPNYSGTSMGWAQEAVQKIAELQRERDRLQRELSEAQAEVSACLRFLAAELGWESFRAEMLYHNDEQKKSTSESNAQKLQNYLADSGHGVAFLREAERLRKDRDTLLAGLREAQAEAQRLRAWQRGRVE